MESARVKDALLLSETAFESTDNIQDSSWVGCESRETLSASKDPCLSSKVPLAKSNLDAPLEEENNEWMSLLVDDWNSVPAVNALDDGILNVDHDAASSSAPSCDHTLVSVIKINALCPSSQLDSPCSPTDSMPSLEDTSNFDFPPRDLLSRLQMDSSAGSMHLSYPTPVTTPQGVAVMNISMNSALSDQEGISLMDIPDFCSPIATSSVNINPSHDVLQLGVMDTSDLLSQLPPTPVSACRSAFDLSLLSHSSDPSICLTDLELSCKSMLAVTNVSPLDTTTKPLLPVESTPLHKSPGDDFLLTSSPFTPTKSASSMAQFQNHLLVVKLNFLKRKRLARSDSYPMIFDISTNTTPSAIKSASFCSPSVTGVPSLTEMSDHAGSPSPLAKKSEKRSHVGILRSNPSSPVRSRTKPSPMCRVKSETSSPSDENDENVYTSLDPDYASSKRRQTINSSFSADFTSLPAKKIKSTRRSTTSKVASGRKSRRSR